MNFEAVAFCFCFSYRKYIIFGSIFFFFFELLKVIEFGFGFYVFDFLDNKLQH